MTKQALILGRFISSLGSLLSSSTILLYLVSQNREGEVPYNLAMYAFGALLGAGLILPRVVRQTPQWILVCTSGFGVFVNFGLCILALNFEVPFQQASLMILNFILGVITSVENPVAQNSLAELNATPQLLHLDSALSTLSRVLSPGAAALLVSSQWAQPEIIFLVDGLSYFIALVIFFAFIKTSGVYRAAHRSISWREAWMRDPKFWRCAALTFFGCAAYNGGAVIYLKAVGLDVGRISVFMMVQNLVMVTTSFAVVRWPVLAKHLKVSSLTAALGLIVICQSTRLFFLCLGTTLLAIGMVTLLHGFRARLATTIEDQNTRSMELGFLGALNPMLGIAGALLFNQLAAFTGWSQALMLGAFIIGLGSFGQWCVAKDGAAP